MRAHLLCCVLLVMGAGCAGHGTHHDASAAQAVPEVSEGTELRFVGTVTSIGMRRDPDPFYRWVVVARVDEVREGAYASPTFAFVVHRGFHRPRASAQIPVGADLSARGRLVRTLS